MEGQNYDQNADFSIGQSDNDKNKKNAPQTAEERIKETYGIAADAHDDLKRKREEYAVQLRKKKK
jgi:hypothetical protein